MSFKVSNIYKSIVRHIMDTMKDAKHFSPDMEYWAWDSRGDDAEMPAVDLIGLAGWSFRENGGLWEIHCGITISTFNDENLFREVDLIDVIHERWGEDCTIPMRDDEGEEYTQLMVAEFEMLPAGQSEKRNYRPIGLTLRRTSSG